MPVSDHRVRALAALILAVGILGAGLAVLSEELGIGAAAAEGVFGWKRITLLAVGLAAAAVGTVLLARPGIASRAIDLDAQADPAKRAVRTVGALILAGGIIAAGLAVLSEELGIGAAAAEGVFGWKRITLLAVGLAAAAVGAVLLAQPGIVAARIDWPRLEGRWRRVRRGLSPLVDPSDRQLRHLAIGLLVLLGLALVWTRLSHIDRSLWHDEAHTVLTYSGIGPSAIFTWEHGFSPNNHAAYNFLSWATVSALGESEAMYRLWSVLPGIAAIAIATWWVWGRIGRVAAVAFATIAVAGPLHLEYAPQARGYGLALLASTLMLVTADRLTHAYSRRTLLALAGIALVGIWTLVIFAIVYVAQGLSLLRWRHLRLPVIVAVGAVGLISVAFYIPTLGGIASAAQSGVSGATIPLHAALLLDRPLEWLVIPTATLLTGEEGRAVLYGSGVLPDSPSATWVDVTVFALLVAGVVGLVRRGKGGLALLLVVPPLFFNVALSLDAQATVTRHQLFLLPYVVALVSTGIAEIGLLIARQRLLKPIAIAVGVVGVLLLSQAIVKEQDGSLPSENFKRVAEIVRGTGIETIVTDSRVSAGLVYYLGDDLTLISSEELGRFLCERPREGTVYIHHRAFSNPRASPRAIECLHRAPMVQVQVPQRGRGFAIDLWIIDPHVSRGGTEEGLG